MLRWTLLLAWCVVAPAVAQSPVPGDPIIPELPGAGRAIDIDGYRVRRARLAARVGTAVVAVTAADLRDLEQEVLQDNDFRQDDYFFYLTGLETPNAWLVLAAKDGSVLSTVLFLPAVNRQAERWTGVQLAPGDHAQELTGIPRVETFERAALDEAVAAAVRSTGGLLHAVTRGVAGEHRMIRDWKTGGRELRDVAPTLDSMRVVKDAIGLRALRRAIAITAEGIREGMRGTHPGMHEFELEATIEYTFRRRGADRLGFPSIVGSGPNGMTLHYTANRRRMEAGELVVVDVGAEYAMYTADVTRTFPVSGRFTARQREVYELVLATQDAVIGAVKPGVTVLELNAIARRFLAEHGGQLCGTAGCGRALPHGVSHWLGMRVHDVGAYGLPLEPGMVLTVEPGVYLPDEQLGVRIEDDILVTEDGAEVLSVGAPRTVEDIERLMRSAELETNTRE